MGRRQHLLAARHCTPSTGGGQESHYMKGEYTATFLMNHSNTTFEVDLTNHDEEESMVVADAEGMAARLGATLIDLVAREETK